MMPWNIPIVVAVFGIAVVSFFVWSFLLTYVILRLVGPSGVGLTLGLSIWSGVVADWTAKHRQRREKLA